MITPLVFEEWRLVDIDGVVKNYYFVSNFGNLRNIKGQIIKPLMINTGYYVYRLYTGDKHAKYKHMLVHRLVKMTFDRIDNPDNYTVNHEDCNKYHNENCNLTWMSQRDNNIHGTITYHKYGENHYKSKINSKELQIILRELNNGNSYSNILKIIGFDDTENNREIIGNIKRGKTYKREIDDMSNE